MQLDIRKEMVSPNVRVCGGNKLSCRFICKETPKITGLLHRLKLFVEKHLLENILFALGPSAVVRTTSPFRFSYFEVRIPEEIPIRRALTKHLISSSPPPPRLKWYHIFMEIWRLYDGYLSR